MNLPKTIVKMDEIPKSNSYHLGHLFLERMRRRPLDAICQIDAATGEKETVGSVLRRTIRTARCFRRLGLQPGDVLMLGGINHLDLRIPYYAALMAGLPVAGVDPFYKYSEIKALMSLCRPKIAFCESETYDDYLKAATQLGIDVKFVTFGGGECTLSKLIETYDNNEPIDDFKPLDFERDKVLVWLMSTSGSTGVPKLAAFRHADIMQTLFQCGRAQGFFGDIKMGFNVSPVQWLSAYINTLGMPLLNICLLQTSKSDSIEHYVDIVNKYRPETILSSPSALTLMMKHEKKCDFTCFSTILTGGAKVYKEMFLELKSRTRQDMNVLVEAYGQTEVAGLVTVTGPDTPLGSCGPALPLHTLKLVEPETGKDITEPYKKGEMWIKGPMFVGYYNNPEETAKVLTKDGWLKSGDLFQKDEHGYYYFIERLKMLIKYRNYHIVPPEIEEVIHTHPGVEEVSVTSVPHPEDGQHVVACVVRRPGSDVTAQEIKDLVASNLTSSKQLRGGVVFLDKLPKTSTGKPARNILQDLVLTAHRE